MELVQIYFQTFNKITIIKHFLACLLCFKFSFLDPDPDPGGKTNADLDPHTGLKDNFFFFLQLNPRVACHAGVIPRMDLSYWRDFSAQV